MVKKILLGLVAVIVVLLIVVAMQPDEYRIERSATIAASTPVVFEQVNDLHKWDAWSPWAKLDPNAKNTFEGAESGEGAIFKWAGNDEVGEGKMTIVESKPNELVKIQLDFLKPFESTGHSEFTFKPDGDKTEVTWAMYGKHSYIEKGICLFMNMDKMLGENFEQGFANMKKIVAGETPEKAAEKSATEEPATGEKPEAAEPEVKEPETNEAETK
jgi:hypothetical protein